jgi:hypothetical protein
MASLSGAHRSQAPGFHLRDLDEDEHDPPSGLDAKGRRLIDKASQGHWKTATFLAALRNDRIDAPCLFDGSINGERFRVMSSSSSSDPQAQRHRDPRQSRLAQGKGRAEGDPPSQHPRTALLELAGR